MPPDWLSSIICPSVSPVDNIVNAPWASLPQNNEEFAAYAQRYLTTFCTQEVAKNGDLVSVHNVFMEIWFESWTTCIEL
jgi:hypothetical protein